MSSSEPTRIRDEIAAVAARLIAEDGIDYAGAKRRAAREVLGDARPPSDCLPDNDAVEAAVREHQALFMGDSQPARLEALRIAARDVMRFLVDAGIGLVPLATGAIVNGTAGEHSDIHLQVFDDNAKDLEIFLLNAGIDFEVSCGDGSRASDETLSFLWPPRGPFGHPRTDVPAMQETVHLRVRDPRDRRVAAPGERTDLAGVEKLLMEGRA